MKPRHVKGFIQRNDVVTVTERLYLTDESITPLSSNSPLYIVDIAMSKINSDPCLLINDLNYFGL